MKHFNVKESAEEKTFASDDKSAANSSSGSSKDGFEKIIRAYADKSEEEIIGEIIRLLASGDVDASKLSSYAKYIMPMLNQEQREKLESILKQLV